MQIKYQKNKQPTLPENEICGIGFMEKHNIKWCSRRTKLSEYKQELSNKIYAIYKCPIHGISEVKLIKNDIKKYMIFHTHYFKSSKKDPELLYCHCGEVKDIHRHIWEECKFTCDKKSSTTAIPGTIFFLKCKICGEEKYNN